MNKVSKVSILILSLSLLIVYFVPIWRINLEAPQYPEGLGMQIWVNRLEGDISTINGLNHYIGMKFIEETSIPELKYMPFILAAIIGFGIIVSISKSKKLLYTWAFLLLAMCVIGGVDFYLWEYDYGHNLDPHAPIKIPGMSYQPPLFGSKELLNFNAHSYPHIGGWIIISVSIIVVVLCLLNLKTLKYDTKKYN
ncbi:MAG: hypothetical protein U0U66_12590 [Cytophagaceae bacterium]